jgi:hypothetical protein
MDEIQGQVQLPANARDAAAFLSTLSDIEQARFLVRFSFELTIAGRATYVVGGEGLDHPERLRLINETLHRALGQADNCLVSEKRRYSSQSIAAILLGHQSEFMSAVTQDAFDRVRALTTKIFVRLLDEGTECWRPVNAKPIGDGVFQILGTVPPTESWEFAPGSRVRCQPKTFEDGSTGPVAFELVVDQP